MSEKDQSPVIDGEVISQLSIRQTEELIAQLEHRIGIGAGAGASRSGEAMVFQILAALRPTAPTIFDAGANRGQYAQVALGNLGGVSDLRVHCFEPSGSTFKDLKAALGSDPRVTLNNFGLAAEPGEARLFMDQAGSGLASLTERRLDHFGIRHGAIQESVRLDTVMRYCSENGIRHIHLLKIDVEGHELDVLYGAKAMLEGGKIDMIQFEFGGSHIDTRNFFQDFFYFFQELEYDLFRILPSRQLLHMPTYREIDEKFRAANYLATRRALDLPRRLGSTVA